MLSTSLVHEIDLLLNTGELSHRKIALRLGVSRGTVNAIASGRRGLHGRDEVKRRPPHLPTSQPTRCPQCGYRVYLPCLICDARSRQRPKRGVRNSVIS
jgi:hypothetical protein